jgi:hypothetical protein
MLGYLKGLGIHALAQTGTLRGREIGSRQVQYRQSVNVSSSDEEDSSTRLTPILPKHPF